MSDADLTIHDVRSGSTCQSLAALLAHHKPQQRPIAVRGDRALLARPLQRVLELFE